MKNKIWALIAVLIICSLFLCACSSKISGELVRYDDIKSLSEAVGFQVRGPSVLPDGYALAGYFAVEDKIAEILFVRGEEEIIFVMTEAKDVQMESGICEEEKKIELGGNEFTFDITDGKVYLATTRKDGLTYAVYSNSGMSEEDMTHIAENMFITDAVSTEE